MALIDWFIVVVPMAYVLWMACRSRRYIHGVADFLSAGRVCGRYVISVSDIANGLAIFTLVANCESFYKTGLGIGFWGNIVTPLWLFIGLTGFCIYRFRETRSMSLGQFLEMRYSRSLRIFASTLRTVADIICNMIIPAISARFFIYLLGLPHHFTLFGCRVSTFAVTIAAAVTLAVFVIWCGGTVALIITDTIQTLLCYPIFAIFVVFLLYTFSWSKEIAPVMIDRVADESFINPYDVEKMRDFNVFALLVGIINTVLNTASWIGAGSTTAGRTPHEQKMAGLLGYFKNGFSLTFFALVGIIIITFMNHRDFAPRAQAVRAELSARIADELIEDAETRQRVVEATAGLPAQEHIIGVDEPLSNDKNMDTPYLDAAHHAIGEDGRGNELFQRFRTLYYQLMMPSVFRETLPRGLFGLFALLMLMLMLSTDDSKIFSASLTAIQDIVVPLCPKPLTTSAHVRLLRIASVIVGAMYFCGSFFMAQMDYISLFIAITASIWIGGAGPVMVGGLYTRFGTTAGAYASLLSGITISGGGILLQRNWAAHIYPWLERHGWEDNVGAFLEYVSRPFWPYVEWHIDKVKFPINSNELLFMAMMTGVVLYCVVSLLTMPKKRFDLDRMLHRGKYADAQSLTAQPVFGGGLKGILLRIMGIDSNYTKGDKVIAWASLAYSVGYGFFVTFILVVVWNRFSKWPVEYWTKFFFVITLCVPCIIAAISTVWFSWGGLVDLRRMFRDLAARKENPEDNGRVE